MIFDGRVMEDEFMKCTGLDLQVLLVITIW
jgi:hypothetical protein